MGDDDDSLMLEGIFLLTTHGKCQPLEREMADRARPNGIRRRVGGCCSGLAAPGLGDRRR